MASKPQGRCNEHGHTIAQSTSKWPRTYKLRNANSHLNESGVCENNAHLAFCALNNPAPPISMLEKRCKRGRLTHQKDERLFRRRLHSRRKRLSSTLNLGARGHSYARLCEMSVIFADTGKPARAVFFRKAARSHISDYSQMPNAWTMNKWRAALSTACHLLMMT